MCVCMQRLSEGGRQFITSQQAAGAEPRDLEQAIEEKECAVAAARKHVPDLAGPKATTFMRGFSLLFVPPSSSSAMVFVMMADVEWACDTDDMH
jgi:hypothetical protein